MEATKAHNLPAAGMQDAGGVCEGQLPAWAPCSCLHACMNSLCLWLNRRMQALQSQASACTAAAPLAGVHCSPGVGLHVDTGMVRTPRALLLCGELGPLLGAWARLLCQCGAP